jgi:hypothetical protein
LRKRRGWQVLIGEPDHVHKPSASSPTGHFEGSGVGFLGSHIYAL